MNRLRLPRRVYAKLFREKLPAPFVGRFYVSSGSSKARGVTEQDLMNKPAVFAGPPQLLQLSLANDRMFVY